MSLFFNITAGYDLAQRVVKSVHGLRGFYDYTEPIFSLVDEKFLTLAAKPHKWTILHAFLLDFESESLESEYDALPLCENIDFFRGYLKMTGMLLPDWLSESEIERHSDLLRNLINFAIHKATISAFQILFNDREFLFEFNILIRQAIDDDVKYKNKKWFNTNGYLRRPTYIPKWLEKAVYHRDKGRCQACFKDVSGVIFQFNQYHLDHIIPLYDGGINDPTNFQLLCRECNLKKGKKEQKPSNQQVSFWDISIA